jgi:AcrR family transcriptional regulator
MPKRLSLTADPADARGRLLEGLAMSIAGKGYGATTIADVVRHARVSKRTFYEHFADKEACYLALYSASTDHLLAVIAESVAVDAPWDERVRASARAYLTELASLPALTRTFLVEIQAAGPAGLARRREIHGRFADLLRAMTAEAARQEPRIQPLTPEMATALVGGINELLLLAVEQGETARLPDLADTAAELILAVVTTPALAR